MTLLLAISSLLSRLLGVYRNHALANLFGASDLSDVYFAAFQIPDTLYRLLVFGAISASFVPIFLSIKNKNEKEAWEFVSSVMNGFVVFVFLLATLVFVFSESFVGLLYPDFSAALQDQTVVLLRIMLVSPILFTFSSIFSGIQNAFRNFWGFALAPIVYNIGIIFGILVLSPSFGINGVAYGVVLGAFLHAFVQFIPALKLGFSWQATLKWSQDFKKLLIVGIPRILSMASFQVNFFIEGVIATTLAVGNLTVLRYAQDLQSFPIGIIGVSMAISSFSIVSYLVIDKKTSQLSHYLRDKLDHLFLLIIPAAFGLYILRFPLIKLILEGGIFDIVAVELTADILAYLCIGLVSAAVTPFVARVYFAFHDTFWPFVISIFTVILNTFLAVLFSKHLGISGIGLASAISSTLSLILLMIVLRWKYLKEKTFFAIGNFIVFTLSALIMTLLLGKLMEAFAISDNWFILLLQIIALTGLGIIIYGAIVFIFLRNKFTEMIKRLGH